MCSNNRRPRRTAGTADEVAARLARAIDDCAAAAKRQSAHPDSDGQPDSRPDAGPGTEADFARRLAALWAMVADADPELAARAARYIER